MLAARGAPTRAQERAGTCAWQSSDCRSGEQRSDTAGDGCTRLHKLKPVAFGGDGGAAHVAGGAARVKSGTHCMSANLVLKVLILPVTSIQSASTHCAGVIVRACSLLFALAATTRKLRRATELGSVPHTPGTVRPRFPGPAQPGRAPDSRRRPAFSLPLASLAHTKSRGQRLQLVCACFLPRPKLDNGLPAMTSNQMPMRPS